MNVFQTKPERAFSAMSNVMPVFIETNVGETQPVAGLNASVKPYWVQTDLPERSRMFCKT